MIRVEELDPETDLMDLENTYSSRIIWTSDEGASTKIRYYIVLQGETILGIYSNQNEAMENAKKQSDDELVSVDELDPGADIMNLKDTYSSRVIWASEEV